MALRLPTPRPTTVVLIVAALWWLMRRQRAPLDPQITVAFTGEKQAPWLETSGDFARFDRQQG
jgi:hypothetical protein